MKSLLMGSLCILPVGIAARGLAGEEPLCISGVYPHLMVHNDGAGESGIGAVVPWAGRLWLITYPQHATKGSPDKLYEIDDKLDLTVRPESVGGTHADRMIHRESNQLIIGPYFIDAQGRVRAADVNKLTGRMTAVARHLTDPANLVYFFDMEGAIYEVNVHTLDVKLLFAKPVPGWHGKGGYTSQGRFVIANNGESAAGKVSQKFLADGPANDPENAGALAEWDGKDWRVVLRRQFTEVTGPGGIHGAPDDRSPLWATGWDKRSVILMLLDGGKWQSFRLPKASHTYDPKHGWFTEWPRIREIGPNQMLMTMHGMMFDFPRTFSAANSAGIKPICSYLRIIPDFCSWNGRVVLGADETTIMANPMAGRCQTNLWFGDYAALKSFGPRAGWGGPWLGDLVKAGAPSEPFLVNGFAQRCLHLAVGRENAAAAAENEVAFALEADVRGDGQWTEYKRITVPHPAGYAFHIFPPDFAAQWVRVKANQDCRATAYFHYSMPGHDPKDGAALFASLADVKDTAVCTGLIRPAKDLSLQFVAEKTEAGATKDAGFFVLNDPRQFTRGEAAGAEEVKTICKATPAFGADEASVLANWGGERYRLPKGAAQFDKPFAWGWPRCIREVETERSLVNAHGTFYELPRENGLQLIKPVSSHGKQISDFCTWHGLLVISGSKAGAKPDGHYFGTDGGIGLWFGQIEDLWRLGKPVGKGGPWLKTPVQAGAPSDPYLMTGYDKKSVQLSHDAREEVRFTLEVDVTHHGWREYQTIAAAPGQTVTHTFPEGYSAHWVRLKANKNCAATAVFSYE